MAKSPHKNQFIRPPLKIVELRPIEKEFRPKIKEALDNQISIPESLIEKAQQYWERIKTTKSLKRELGLKGTEWIEKLSEAEEGLDNFLSVEIDKLPAVQNESEPSKQLRVILTALWIRTFEVGLNLDRLRFKNKLEQIDDPRVKEEIANWKFRDIKLTNPLILDQIEHMSFDTVKGLNNTQKDRLRVYIRNGIVSGKSINEIATDTKVLRELNGRRSYTIIRSEIQQAKANETRTYLQERGVGRWTWNCNQPVDFGCLINCGETRRIGDSFPSGDAQPLVHNNCECYMEEEVPTGITELEIFITAFLIGRDWIGN